MNTGFSNFSGYVNSESNGSYGQTQAPNVVWALQVTPPLVNTDNSTTGPYAINYNIENDIPPDRCLLPILQTERLTSQPLPLVMDLCQGDQLSVMRAIPPSEIQRQVVVSKSNVNTPKIIRSNLKKSLIIEVLPIPQQIKESLISRSPSRQVQQKINYNHIEDAPVVVRAEASLPAVVRLSRGALCVKRQILPKTRFGPVQGIHREISKHELNNLVSKSTIDNTPIFLLCNKNGGTTHIDVSDHDKSNWFSLVRLGDNKSANLWLHQDGDQLYALTVAKLLPRSEIALGYSMQYAREHALPHTVPTLDLFEEMPTDSPEWQCQQCTKSFATAAKLDRHMDVHHKEDAPRSRLRQYRCRYCSQSFTRLFGLKRHMRLHCNKISNTETSVQSDKADQQLSTSYTDKLNISPNTLDDVKLPSDESFQNILEFSNTIFDPDRSLPNLDLSGSSKSDSPHINYFNNSDILNKCDGGLEYDFNYDKGSLRLDESINGSDRQEQVMKEPTDKKETTSKDLKKPRYHGRRWNCECGSIFLSKQRFVRHVQTKHTLSSPSVEGHTKMQLKKLTKKQSRKPVIAATYSCEDCNIKFKRRGMLLNHWHRYHPERPNRAASMPILKRVKHYLCCDCPRVYLTATKRDRHVRVHHPGRTLSPRSSYCIEGGVQEVNASICPICPRQYVTKAKLQQHIRSKHSELV